MIKKRTHFGSMYYPEFEHAEIEANLNKIYTLYILMECRCTSFLKVDSIHFVRLGTLNRFRIRVKEIF